MTHRLRRTWIRLHRRTEGRTGVNSAYAPTIATSRRESISRERGPRAHAVIAGPSARSVAERSMPTLMLSKGSTLGRGLGSMFPPPGTHAWSTHVDDGPPSRAASPACSTPPTSCRSRASTRSLPARCTSVRTPSRSPPASSTSTGGRRGQRGISRQAAKPGLATGSRTKASSRACSIAAPTERVTPERPSRRTASAGAVNKTAWSRRAASRR